MIRQLTAALFAALLCASALASGNAPAVDANRATQAELETIKGIGPGLSGKILQARQTGAFKDWTDLVDRVGGVGPGNAQRFSERGLTVSGVAYAAATAAAGTDGQPAAKARSGKATKADPADKADKADKAAKSAKTAKTAG
jgi:competence protein ComEA